MRTAKLTDFRLHAAIYIFIAANLDLMLHIWIFMPCITYSSCYTIHVFHAIHLHLHTTMCVFILNIILSCYTFISSCYTFMHSYYTLTFSCYKFTSSCYIFASACYTFTSFYSAHLHLHAIICIFTLQFASSGYILHLHASSCYRTSESLVTCWRCDQVKLQNWIEIECTSWNLGEQ